MATHVLTAADLQRPLSVRRRGDLVFSYRPTSHRSLWTVKDPVALSYFQLRSEEKFIFDLCDGQTSPAAILDRFGRQFAPRRLTPVELLTFVRRLVAQGLVVDDAALPQAAVLRFLRRDRNERWARLASPLAIRFRGVDPQVFLDTVAPLVRGLFSPWALVLAAVLILSAVAHVGVHWDEFQRRLPGMQSFLQPGHLPLLAGVLAGVKILHELGHAFACRRFGGECREIGVMLLAFTPCLYCNVSDAWLLPERSRRIAVSAAGIVVELTLAAVATFLWWNSVPGLFHSLCFSIMAIASVNTLLLNGNPLLRYDGYYILADLLDVPNLRARAAAALRRTTARLFFGVEEPPDAVLSSRWTLPLCLYGAASAVYLWIVVIAILWLIAGLLRPYGLEPIAAALAAVVIGAKLVGQVRGAHKQVYRWRNAGQVTRLRLAAGLILIAGATAALLLTPLPYAVEAPFAVRLHEPHAVRVTVPGRPAADSPVVQPRQRVSRGEVLAVLENPDVTSDLVKLEGRVARQALLLEHLEQRQFSDPQAAEQIPTARAALRDFEARLARRREDLAALTLRAPAAGVVFPPPSHVAPTPPGQLPRMTGTPLDAANRQAWLLADTAYCIIGDAERLDAIVVVDQSGIADIRVGSAVRLQLPESGREILSGRVDEISQRDLEFSPRPLVVRRELASERDATGAVRPISTTYEVRVAIDVGDRSLTLGASGQARIEAGTRTLLDRALQFLRRTFAASRS